jgi:hypothetical protein
MKMQKSTVQYLKFIFEKQHLFLVALETHNTVEQLSKACYFPIVAYINHTSVNLLINISVCE